MKRILIIAFLLVIFASCSRSNECDNVIIAPPEILLKIFDGDGNSLIGEENIYKPSEITLSRDNQIIPLSFPAQPDGVNLIMFNYSLIESNADYMLKLNEDVTDILNLKTAINEGECNQLIVEILKYNGVTIFSETTIYTIIK